MFLFADISCPLHRFTQSTVIIHYLMFAVIKFSLSTQHLLYKRQSKRNNRKKTGKIKTKKVKETVTERLSLLEKVFCYLWGVAKTI